MTNDRDKRDGLTHQEWLDSAPNGLPEGFRDWDAQYECWNQHSPIGWAIYCFRKEAQKRRGYKESGPRPQKRETPKLENLHALAELLADILKLKLIIGYGFEGKELTTGLPRLNVYYPDNNHGFGIKVDEYGRYWANEKIPGVPGKVIRTWPKTAFLIDI